MIDEVEDNVDVEVKIKIKVDTGYD